MEIFQNDNHFDDTHNAVVGLQLKMSKRTKKRHCSNIHQMRYSDQVRNKFHF